MPDNVAQNLIDLQGHVPDLRLEAVTREQLVA